MIINGLLLVVQAFLNILLAPLSVVNIAVDFLLGIDIVVNFVQVVAYIVPFNNLVPLFRLTFALFGFRIAIAILRFIKSLIPTLRGYVIKGEILCLKHLKICL